MHKELFEKLLNSYLQKTLNEIISRRREIPLIFNTVESEKERNIVVAFGCVLEELCLDTIEELEPYFDYVEKSDNEENKGSVNRIKNVLLNYRKLLELNDNKQKVITDIIMTTIKRSK